MNTIEEKILEKIIGAPSDMLDKTLSSSEYFVRKVKQHNYIKRARDYWYSLGPGLTTGAADDDPSGIATYSQAGAQFGNKLLWLAPFTFPLMAIVQEMCARIGLVTGRGLAGNIRIFFPKWVSLLAALLLLTANTLNIGADLGAMAKATQLFLPKINFAGLIIFFTVISLALQIFTTYAGYAKYLKWLALILLSYVFTTLSIQNLNWDEVIRSGFVPKITFSKDMILIICGVLGTTISPYLFFWQTSQEVEEEILAGKTSLKLRQEETTNKEITNMRLDIWSGMFLSNLVMFFIIVACGAVLFSNGITNINTAADAAEALRPFAGNWAYTLFALGIIGTGMLAIPVLAGGAAYALSESFAWKHGLYRKLRDANAFYGVIILSMFVGVLLNFIGFDPIKALIYSAVVNGLIAPVILIIIILISNNKKIMGNRVNHPVTTFFGWLITIIMIVAGSATIYTLFK